MKKRIMLFTFMVSFLCAAVFGQTLKFNTSEGEYWVYINYIGKNAGQQKFDTVVRGARQAGDRFKTDIKLTKAQWECVQRALNSFDTAKGDTFRVHLSLVGNNRFLSDIFVYCEYTSATEYTYWTFEFY